MLTYPFLYLYFKNLISDNKSIHLNELKHFIPLIILTIINKVISNSSISQSILVYYIYTLFFLFYTLFYLLITYQILQREIWKKVGKLEIVIRQNKLLKNWSFFLFSAFLVISIRNLILILMSVLNYPVTEDYLWISVITFLILFIKILATPEILHGYNFLIQKINNEKNSSISIESFWSIKPLQQIINVRDVQLKEIINESVLLGYIKKINLSVLNECFKKRGFSISDFAKELNIPKSHLSYLFKYHSKISFTDFKKIARIHYSLKLIEANFLITNTLDTLSKEVGFVSYNTFFISFKEVTGINPIDYNKNKEKCNVI
nr:AraC family transcriptional regulator [uncultured Flavobacterium sp.]